MNRVGHFKEVQISPSYPKPRDLFPIVDIDALSSSTPCSTTYPSTSTTHVRPSVRNKYIMQRFANDLKQFATPHISTKYKIDKSNAPLSVKGRSISRLSCSSSSSSRKSYTEEKQFDNITRTICLEGCRYDVVRRIALELRFCEVSETDFWNILWTDSPISLEKAYDMRRLQQQNIQHSFWGPTMNSQKTNHFPGMHEICRKDRLARNLNRMQKIFPEDYQFYPRTWTLPSDIPELLAYFRTNRSQTIICKPDSGCQGKGIFLVRNLKKMNPFAKLIAQIYIPNPLLIDGYKFDLRIYILITSCDPLRMYIYNEGIARFATVKYSSPNDHNVDVVFMHLTNYSLNKFSQSYVPDPEGSKRKLSTVYGYLLERGFNVEKMVEDIDDIIIKTVMAAQPTLQLYYNASFPQINPGGSSCFEILGFDILVDENLKPWLLEVNLSPSFNLDLPVDAEVKEALLRDTFQKIFLGTVTEKTGKSEMVPPKKGIVNHTPSPEIEIMDKAGNNIPKNMQKQFYHEQLNQGSFRLIYPTDNCFKYAEFLNPDLNVFSANEMSVPISRRGTSLTRYTNDTEESVPRPKIIQRLLLQPTNSPRPKVFQAPPFRTPLTKDPTTSNSSTPRNLVNFKSTPEPPTANTSGGSDSSFVSAFNEVTTPIFEKGDHLKTKVKGDSSKKKVKKKKMKELEPVPDGSGNKKGQCHGPPQGQFHGPAQSQFHGPAQSQFHGPVQGQCHGPAQSQFHVSVQSQYRGLAHGQSQGLAQGQPQGPAQGQHKVKMAQLVDERGARERIIVNTQDGLNPVNVSSFHQNSNQPKVNPLGQLCGGGEPRRSFLACHGGAGHGGTGHGGSSPKATSNPTTHVPDPKYQSHRNIDCTPMASSVKPNFDEGHVSTPNREKVKESKSSAQAPRPAVSTTKTKLVEEWILNGVNAGAAAQKRKARSLSKIQKETFYPMPRWDNFAHEALKKSRSTTARTNSAQSFSSKRSSTLPLPVLAHEEDDRKEMLKVRERAIRQMGIEGTIYEMMQETGTLTMEEDLIYNKIFSEEEFVANRNGSSTLLNPRAHSVVLVDSPRLRRGL